VSFVSRSLNSLLTRFQQTPSPEKAHLLRPDGAMLGNLAQPELASSKQRLVAIRGLLNGDRPIPLSWAAATGKSPFANLGDALSPIIVSALSGQPAIHQHFDAWSTRLACVGTIGHQLKNGTIHLWGTGASKRKPFAAGRSPYRWRNTQFHFHALRGPFSAQAFQQQGIEVPARYGEPVWFLPAILPPAPKKRYELGIIVHLSELASYSDRSPLKPGFLRYQIPPDLAEQVRVITTLTQPTFTALADRIEEITACKRIISTSLHGLVIAEAYQIPCVYFRTKGRGVAFAPLEDESEYLDLRIRDFYSGTGLKQLFVYGQVRGKATNWEKLIDAIDRYWQPLDWSAEDFLEAFPLPLAFNPLRDQISDRTLFQQLKF
jgi:pyruvyltransferase